MPERNTEPQERVRRGIARHRGHRNQRRIPPYNFDFIEPLFAIAVHIGLAEGLLKEEWAEKWQWPSDAEWFHIKIFALGFITLVASWLGYHESIRTKRLKGGFR